MVFKKDVTYKIYGYNYKFLGYFKDEYNRENLVFEGIAPYSPLSSEVRFASDYDEKILIKKFNLKRESVFKIIIEDYLHNFEIEEVKE